MFATPVAQRTAPSAIVPCPSIIRNAFIRPRTHPGITRCPATQSSDPASAQATPANLVETIKAGTWRMNAIAKTTATINHVAVTSWAETKMPDNTLANHSRRNTGFRSENQVEVDFVFIAADMICTQIALPGIRIALPSNVPSVDGPRAPASASSAIKSSSEGFQAGRRRRS